MTGPLQIDYDKVAPDYDRRVRGSYLMGVTSALHHLAQQVKARRILDLGCGTGRSLQGVADGLRPAAIAWGLDLSAGMLAQARRLDSHYRLVQALAPRLPFQTGSFDLVYCAHAFHHFYRKAHVVQAAYNILRPGGAFAIVNFDPRECGWQDWPIYEYFDGTYETDLKRFPALVDQEAMLRQAGFYKISSPIVQHIRSDVVGEDIFDNYHIQKEACSQLILLTEEAYQAGLQRMRDRIERASAIGETVIFRTRLKNRMCHGIKPPAATIN